MARIRAAQNATGRVRTGERTTAGGGIGQLVGSIFGQAIIIGRRTQSLRGAIGASATFTGALTLKVALVGAVPGSAAFTANLTGPAQGGVLDFSDANNSALLALI